VTSTDQPGAPSEDELRAYVDQLRRAEPAEIVLQAFTMLGTGAEAKLGRPDARVLIDALIGMVQAVGDRLGPQLTAGMRNGLQQLQMLQVEAERQAATPPAGAAPGAPPSQPPPAQPGAAAAPPPAAAQPPAAPRGGSGRGGQGEPMTDRLWIPGRGPRASR